MNLLKNKSIHLEIIFKIFDFLIFDIYNNEYIQKNIYL
jgi:hypothetical protein